MSLSSWQSPEVGRDLTGQGDKVIRMDVYHSTTAAPLTRGIRMDVYHSTTIAPLTRCVHMDVYHSTTVAPLT